MTLIKNKITFWVTPGLELNQFKGHNSIHSTGVSTRWRWALWRKHQALNGEHRWCWPQHRLRAGFSGRQNSLQENWNESDLKSLTTQIPFPIASEGTIRNILGGWIFAFITIQISSDRIMLWTVFVFYTLRINEFISFFLKADFEVLI